MVTNNEIIADAMINLSDNERRIEASPDFVEGFIAGMKYLEDHYEEYDQGNAYVFLSRNWDKLNETKTDISCHAKFKQMNSTDGTIKLVFEPSGKCATEKLILMTGQNIFLSVGDPQLSLDLEKRDLPQAPPKTEPLELPEGSVEVDGKYEGVEDNDA